VPGDSSPTHSTGPNINQAIGRAVDQILSLDYPERFAYDQTYINIAILESGSVFNRKPGTGWFSLDMLFLDKILEIPKFLLIHGIIPGGCFGINPHSPGNLTF
jgi:hypothetical protein